MKTFFKNLFITGLLITVVFSLFNIPSVQAEGDTERDKNQVLCEGVKKYLEEKGISKYSSCMIETGSAAGTRTDNCLSYSTNTNACGHFSVKEIKILRTLYCEIVKEKCTSIESKTITTEIETILCQDKYLKDDRALRGVCDAFSNDEALDNLEKVIDSTLVQAGRVHFIGAMDAYQSGKEAPNSLEETDDCLRDYADLTLFSSLSPGRMIRGFFAAIAIGARGIVGLVADGLINCFTVLPQKLGGYVHFGPISDPDTGIWRMMQIYANFGIIIMMIFMAIATILGIEKFSYKKMLWKLLLVALLINFSLIICGMLVDVSNFLSYHFLSNSANGNLGSTVKGVITKTSCAIAGPDDDAFVPTMIGVAVAIILGSIFLFQFAGLLFYVISRIITIWICLAVSPLAFLGMAIDAEPVKKAVTMWRDKFTQALVALPILSFTLYFVLIILTKIAIQIKGISGNDDFGFVMLIAYSVVVIALAQVLRAVAKSIGVEQIEQGYAFAQKAVMGAVKVGALAVGGFALGKAITAGARTETDEAGNEVKVPSYYDRAAQATTRIPLVGNKLAMNLYRVKGRVMGKAAEKINKDIELFKDDANALDAYFSQALSALGKMKAITAKAKAGLVLTDQQMDWYRRSGSSAFEGTEDNKTVQSALPVLRNGGNIGINELTRRIIPVLQNREKSEKLLGTNIFDYMHTNRPGEFPLFVHQILENIGSPQQLENLLLSINTNDRERIVGYINDSVDNRMGDFLQGRNPRLREQIMHPSSRESGAASNLQQYFTFQ